VLADDLKSNECHSTPPIDGLRNAATGRLPSDRIGWVVRDRLERLSAIERRDLEEFFRISFRYELSAYVIFFDKPSAWVGAGKADFEDGRWRLSTEWEGLKKSGVQILDRHFSDLVRNFSFVESRNEISGSRDHLLLNRSLCLVRIEENLDLFCYALRDDLTPEGVFRKIETSGTTPLKLLGGSHAALGVLLGINRTDALMFQQMMTGLQRSELSETAARESQRLRDLSQNVFDNISDWRIEDILASTPEAHILDYVTWEPDSEVARLQEKFALEKAEIADLTRTADFLERVLVRLCS
jgi:hypothetical protein